MNLCSVFVEYNVSLQQVIARQSASIRRHTLGVGVDHNQYLRSTSPSDVYTTHQCATGHTASHDCQHTEWCEITCQTDSDVHEEQWSSE